MRNLFVLCTAMIGLTHRLDAANFTVSGKQNPWLITANPFQPDGDRPALFTDFAPGDRLEFSAAGSVAFNPGLDSGPDGTEDFPITHGAVTHISGVIETPANALLGVFLDDSDPISATDTPPDLDFTTSPQRNFATQSPALRQMFFIGDGKTTAGTRQSFVVPAGAKRLYLGVLDRANWASNEGSFDVTVTQGGAGPQLTPITSFSYRTSSPIRTSNLFQFTATESAVLSDLRVRVQSSTTPTVEGSWTDLPTGSQMSRLDNTWTTTAIDLPSGTEYFRAIASAPGFPDQVSTVIGPLTILPGISPFGNFSYSTTAPARTGVPWTFTIQEPSDFVGLRVQSSATPEVESSWSDLPGGGGMTRHGDLWSLSLSDIPAGNLYFRAIASAANYPDRVSALLGPIRVQEALPVVKKTQAMSGKYSLQSLEEPAKTPGMILAEAIGVANVHFALGDFVGGSRILAEAMTFYAIGQATIDVTVGEGESLTVPGLNIGPNADLVLKGTINGDVGIYGVPALPMISNDGASIISNDGNSLISNDGGSIQFDAASAQQISAAAALAEPAGSALISPNGGTVLSTGQGGLIPPNGASLIGPNGASRPIGVRALNTASVSAGVMTINGNYHQDPGTALMIAITGTNNTPLQYDHLIVNGRAELGGVIAFGFFNMATGQPTEGPAEGSVFDVVTATNITTNNLLVRGPLWGNGLHFRGDVVNVAEGRQALRLTAVRIPPVLAVERADSLLRIAYPTNYIGMTLESSTSLGKGNWSAVSTGTNLVTLPASNSAAFFRLRKP